LLGRQAEPVHHGPRVVNCDLRHALCGGRDLDRLRDKLQLVEVPRDDKNIVSEVRGLAGKRSDDIIRLVARRLQNDRAETSGKVASDSNLGTKLLRGRLARGFVFSEYLVPEGLSGS